MVDDRSQGVQLATTEELARYWSNDYDWHRCEDRLNARPQFLTEIDGVDIHFIHVRVTAADALPLIMTHGWPGSVIELLEAVGPLTDPTAHGGRPRTHSTSCCRRSRATASRANRPRSAGTPAGPQGVGGVDDRLGYTATSPKAATWARITDAMARQAPEGLLGMHMNLLVTGLGGAIQPVRHRRGAGRIEQLATFRASGFGYFLEQATRPQTIGYALLDSPVALAAWMLDHDTDAY